MSLILADKTAHLRVLKPLPFVYAFYDGRVPNARLHRMAITGSTMAAMSLGTASYAIVDEDDALIYDTHLSVDHGLKIRRFIEALGVKRMRVVPSHRHLDHVAGNAAFADCEIIANTRTLAHLERQREAIEAGTFHGPPAINPLVLPNKTFETHLRLDVGRIPVDLHLADIHSDDATVLASRGIRPALCRAIRWRTPSPMWRSRARSTRISPNSTGCGAGTSTRYCPITVIPS